MDADLPLGAEVAGHRLERVIGRGGMSVVYLAEHLRLGRKVAFKVLAANLAGDEGFRERFIRESRTAAGLDHPNIVTVYDAGEFDGRLFISMRYVEGSDLGHVLSVSGALEPWRTLTILSQVGSALDVAHSDGLVHRDVKPGNILLSQPGSPLERAFLSDFGVTKRITTSTGLTRTGQFVGTIDYVAPEQILGEPLDGRTDVYSLGCVLYQCLSGAIPFPRPSDVATIYAHLHDPTPVLTSEAFPGMDPVIGRSLAKTKEARYPTCSALVEAARSQLLGGAPTATTAVPAAVLEDTVETAIPRGGRRGRSGWIVGGLAVIAIATLAIAITASRRPGGTAAGSASPSSPAAIVTQPPGPAPLLWQEATWDEFGNPSGQVAFTDALTTTDDDVIAVGHADDPTEDAVVWTHVIGGWRRHYPAGQHTPGAQKLEGIAQVDGGRLITVGYDAGHAVGWYSDDSGASWVPVSGLESGADAKAVVQAPDGEIWTLGLGATWMSSGGATWTAVSSPAFPPGSYAWNAVPVGQSVVAVGAAPDAYASYDAAIWVLRDGAWARVDPQVFDESGQQYLRDIAVDPGSGLLVAVGADGDRASIWTSPDASAWTLRHAPGDTNQAMSSILFLPGNPDRFISGGWNGASPITKSAAVWFSRDGLTWSLERGLNNTHDLDGPGAQEIRALVPYRAGHIAVKAFGTEGGESAGRARLWNGSLLGT